MFNDDPTTDIQIIATLLVALVFSKRVKLRRWPPRVVAFIRTAQTVAGIIGVLAVLWWPWAFMESAPAYLGTLLRFLAMTALSIAVGASFFVWGVDGKWEDPVPRGRRAPKE